MASVTFLGTGPGDCLPGRFQTSILLQSDSTNVLLDAGEPCAGQLLNLEFSLQDIDAVWLSHAHADHVSGLPLLLQAAKCRGRTGSLPVGLPRHLLCPLQDWLRAIFLLPGIVDFPVEFFSWEAGITKHFADLSVTPHLTSHLDRTRINLGRPDIEAFLFEIEFAGKRMICSGDLGSLDDLTPHLQRPIDLLICEMSHLLPEVLIESLSAARIGTLCFTHLSADASERRGELKLICADKLSGTGDIYFPDDGERLEF